MILSMSNLSVSLEPSCTNETVTSVYKQVWLWLPGKMSQAATPAIRAMFPLAPLKVADVTGGLHDISGGSIM